MILIVPILVLPINNRLLSILHDSNALATAKANGLTASQENEIEDLFQKWQNLHYVRIVVGGVGWLGALAAYTLIV
jgi:hypothetical protein